MPPESMGKKVEGRKERFCKCGCGGKTRCKQKRNKYQRIWASKNRVKTNRYEKNWIIRKPWYQSYHSAASRVKYPSHHYYKKHLEFTMTVNDFRYLWFRDKAYKMEKPSIDRI